jgi:hypothetical protein
MTIPSITPRISGIVAIIAVAATLAACSIRTAHPIILPDNPVLRRPVAVELDPASTAETYRFTSWLSFPAVGSWTYDVGGDFGRYAAAFSRDALSTSAGTRPQSPLRLHLTLVGYDLDTVYRATCSIRATLIDPSNEKILLDRNYAGVGRTAFLRVFFFGWFFGVGTRSGVRATMDGAFAAAFGKIATDVASKASGESRRSNSRLAGEVAFGEGR